MMDTSRDCMKLNDHKIFQTVRETLPKTFKKSINILTVHDNVLFVWNHQDCCILTLNLKAVRGENGESVGYQTLLPTKPIPFEVHRLRVNGIMSLLALSGPNGICVMELPRRGGKHGAFGTGKEVVYCASHMLDERLYTCSAFLECQQTKWHPGSPNDSHLLTLTSDNEIRVYEILSGSAVLKHVWPVGEKPMGKFGTSKTPMLVALGETGVDFDFGPPEVPSDVKKFNNKPWESIIWPVYIVRGNGDIYMLHIRLNGNAFDEAKLRGPLRMYPAADDNYGVDACAIICLQSNPPVIAISTCTGTVYHCIALTPEDMEDDWQTDDNSQLPRKCLHVFESIELELGLTLSESEPAHTCPIFFQPDEMNKSRYFCAHDTGVHAITVPMVGQIEQYIECSEENIDLYLPTFNKHSTAEYLVCTHAAPSSKLNHVLGISMTYNPNILIVLLSSGEVVSLTLISVHIPPIEVPEIIDTGDLISPTKKILRQQFDDYIKTFLKPNLSQPILKLSVKDETDPQECFELLSRVTQTFREEHFQRLEKVREEIEKRVKALQILKTYQLKEIQRLEIDKEETQTHAEKLAEKYEDIKEKQEELMKRAEILLRLVNQNQPKRSVAEEHLEKDLQKYEQKMKYFKKMYEQVRNKQKYQALQIEQWRSQQEKKQQYLKTNQSDSIKTNLEKMTNDLISMRKEVEFCKKELNIQ